MYGLIYQLKLTQVDV